jgi:hypothetical protein
MLKEALEYAKSYSIIPVQRDKKPYINWKPYQERRATEQEVREWWGKWPDAGIGLVTGKVSGVSVVDVDTKEGFDAILEYIPDSLLMPTSNTPKGGQHMFFKDCGLGNAVRMVEGCDFRGEHGYVIVPPSMNGNGKGYTWCGGLDLSTGLVDLPASLKTLLSSASNRYSPQNTSKEVGGIVKGGNLSNIYITNINGVGNSVSNDKMFQYGRRDEDLFHVANCLVRGKMNEVEIFQVLENLMLSWGEQPDKQWIRTKIMSALDRGNKRISHLTDDVREFVLSTNGNFLSTDVHNCLHLSTREEKKNVSMILKRLSDEKIIEKYGNKNGCFRLIDTDIAKIDWMNTKVNTLNVTWPFEIEDLVVTMPGNIVIIAGESNSGKTGFVLNLIKENMHKFDIQYFSSEMGPMEMKARLEKFEDVNEEDWNFSAWERMDNFADVVKPDSINIIDFLEVYDEFYKVGGMIRDIYDKLDKGIAVICLQKNKGSDHGLGGARSIEKARLYMSMGNSQIKIVKGKNWANPHENPNGLYKDFALVGGCKFVDQSMWKRDEDAIKEIR